MSSSDDYTGTVRTTTWTYPSLGERIAVSKVSTGDGNPACIVRRRAR